MFAFRTPPPLSRAIHGIIQLYGAELSVQPEYKSDSDISSACLTQVSQKTKAKHDSESCWPKKNRMAAAEEEARQKALKALKEKNDMLIAIKERKQESQLLKYYANDKYKEHVKEKDKDGMLPIHWAAHAQCKNNVFECLLEAFPEGIKEKTKDGLYCLHMLCSGVISGDTEKAIANKIKDKNEAVATLVKAFPNPTWIKVDGKLPIHQASKNGAPEGAIAALLEGYAEGAKIKEEGEGGDGNLALHNAAISLKDDKRKAKDEVFELLIDAYSEGAAVTNDKGNLPLHYAAEKQCSEVVAKALLKAFPDSAKARDERNLLALQIAAMFQAKPEVVVELIHVYPDATRVRPSARTRPTLYQLRAP